MTRGVALAVALLVLAACGKYGPPVRTSPEAATPAKSPTPAAAAPATSSSEQCDDPNAVTTQAKP